MSCKASAARSMRWSTIPRYPPGAPVVALPAPLTSTNNTLPTKNHDVVKDTISHPPYHRSPLSMRAAIVLVLRGDYRPLFSTIFAPSLSAISTNCKWLSHHCFIIHRKTINLLSSLKKIKSHTLSRISIGETGNANYSMLCESVFRLIFAHYNYQKTYEREQT